MSDSRVMPTEDNPQGHKDPAIVVTLTFKGSERHKNAMKAEALADRLGAGRFTEEVDVAQGVF